MERELRNQMYPNHPALVLYFLREVMLWNLCVSRENEILGNYSRFSMYGIPGGGRPYGFMTGS